MPFQPSISASPNHSVAAPAKVKGSKKLHPIKGFISGLAAFLKKIPTLVCRAWKSTMKWCRTVGVTTVQLWKRGWNAELANSVFVALSLAGLAITLAVHQDKPLPEWPRLININSLVSIFTLFIRAGLATILTEGISQSKWQWFRKSRQLIDMESFDSASRGPLGSTALLLSFRRRKPYYLAAFGALLTILSSLTGFFSQQILQFEGCPRHLPGTKASIAKTNNYLASGFHVNPGVDEVYFPIAAAINMGIIQPNDDPTSTLTRGCISGNCTFSSDHGATFSTVAMDYACENITAELHRVESNKTQEISYSLDLEDRGALVLSAIGPVKLRTGIHFPYYGSDRFNPIFTLYLLYRTMTGDQGDSQNSALNCSIFPSVKTYSANISNSTLSETLISSIPIGYNVLGRNGPDPSRYRLATSRTLRNGTWKECTGQEKPQPGLVKVAHGNIDRIPRYNYSRIDEEWQVLWYPEDCVWSFGTAASNGIVSYVETILHNQTFVYLPGLTPQSGPIYLRKMYQEGAINLESVRQLMKNLTDAMTTTIRTNGHEGEASHAKGDVIIVATCVHVRWPWIAFPATIFGLTVIFLGFASLESRGVPANALWKSSTLAILYCKLDYTTVSSPLPLTKHGLEESANSTTAYVEKDICNLKLKLS